MRLRARLLLGFAIATMVTQACSSPDSSPASPDSGDGGGGPGVDSSSGVDSGMSMMSCDASLPLGGDAGGACTACKVMKCSGELRQCAADCTCGRIEACLETNDLIFNICPDAINAVMGGDPPLTSLTVCLDTNCLAPCFHSSTSGDSSISDAGGH
jgi:hypothetical protein